MYGIRFSFRGWGVCKRDGVLVNGMGCYCSVWVVHIQDAVLVYWMEC